MSKKNSEVLYTQTHFLSKCQSKTTMGLICGFQPLHSAHCTQKTLTMWREWIDVDLTSCSCPKPGWHFLPCSSPCGSKSRVREGELAQQPAAENRHYDTNSSRIGWVRQEKTQRRWSSNHDRITAPVPRERTFQGRLTDNQKNSVF